MKQRIASLSLDLDNLWSYLKIHGDSWEKRPSYLDTFVPYILQILEDLNLQITFFVVGIDAADSENRDALRSIAAAGHEIGNHSFEHEPWLQTYSQAQLVEEINNAHEAITAATGETPIGFRGPGFSWSPQLLEVLADKGYLFDASTLPTFLGPLARAYYFWTSDLSKEDKAKRKELFGTFRDGLRPVKPYYWGIEDQQPLLEIPVTTMPFLKTPFHFSYLVFLSRFSEGLMMLYLRTALMMCRVTGTEPSFLLHPLDIIGGDRIPELDFFPGMDVASERKKELFVKVLNTIAESFEVVPMGEHARRIVARGNLDVRPAAG
jgi:peptidoglycan/xylan/chitin deacetylase (PgdA/CDA1 family)